jgi:hypothetical protein
MPETVRRIQDWAVSTSAGLLLIGSLAFLILHAIGLFSHTHSERQSDVPAASNLQRRSQLGGSITLGHLIPDRSLQFPIGMDSSDVTAIAALVCDSCNLLQTLNTSDLKPVVIQIQQTAWLPSLAMPRRDSGARQGLRARTSPSGFIAPAKLGC